MSGIGDEAQAAGFPLVPETGEELARVRWGAQEINRTRDFIAQVRNMIPNVWPISKGGTGANNHLQARVNLGIQHGTADPSGGSNGDIYFKIV